MALFSKLASEIWRDFETAGVPSSGGREPYKPDIRSWGEVLESRLVEAQIVNVKDHGATGDGVTDETAAFNAAIAAINAAGSNNTGTGNGFVLYIPPGRYSVPSALTTITVDGVTVRGAGRDATILLGLDGVLFTFGSGAAFIDTVGVENLSLFYEIGVTPGASATLAKLVHGTRMVLRAINLYRAPQLLDMLSDTGKSVSNILIDDISGTSYNTARAFIHKRGVGSGSGLYLRAVRIFPDGVAFPLESTTDAHPVTVGCDFLKIDENWDTIVASDCVINRFYRGINFNALTTGLSIGNIFFSNFVIDYTHTAINLFNAGGNITKFQFRNGWINSTDGQSVALTSTSGLMSGIEICDNFVLMAGTNNIAFPAAAQACKFNGNIVYGCGRLASPSYGVLFSSGAQNCEARDNVWEDPQPYYGASGVRLPTTCIAVSGAGDPYVIEGNLARASATYYSIPAATAGGRERSVARNRRSDAGQPEYLTMTAVAITSAVDIYNHTGMKAIYYVRGDGAVTVSNVKVNGSTIFNDLPDSLPATIVVEPGGYWQATFTGGSPAVVRQLVDY